MSMNQLKAIGPKQSCCFASELGIRNQSRLPTGYLPGAVDLYRKKTSGLNLNLKQLPWIGYAKSVIKTVVTGFFLIQSQGTLYAQKVPVSPPAVLQPSPPPLLKIVPPSQTSQPFEAQLESIQRSAIRYFLEHRDLQSSLVLDRAPADGSSPNGASQRMASIAATGFGMATWLLAAEKGLISKTTAKAWVNQTLDFVDRHNPKENRGWLFHFIDIKTGEPFKNSEVSSIDTALFYWGALAAGEYFGGSTRAKVHRMLNHVDFDMMLTDDGQQPKSHSFNLGFHMQDGKPVFLKNRWDTYSEGILVPLLALGSKQNTVPKKIWLSGWQRHYDTLPLFTYQYPHAFLNFRHQADRLGTKLWVVSQTAHQDQKKYCHQEGYPEHLFGISACDGPQGYQIYTPQSDKNNKPLHDGTIAPPALLSSTYFDPKSVETSMQALSRRGLLGGHYGIVCGANLNSGWKSPDALGIDLGSMILMIDAANTGTIHRLVHQSHYVQRALRRATLRPEPLETRR